MKRRNFLGHVVLGSGSLVLGTACGRKIDPQPADKGSLPPVSESGKAILEPAREIPILAETDVLVIGGGPAGTAAAIASSRTGAETYLVERYNHLGGLWTGGLVLPLLSTHAVNQNQRTQQVIYGIGGEMSQRLKDLGMSISEVDPVIDPEAGKYVLDEMILEAGVNLLYHTWATNVIMDGKRIAGVFVESKSGRMAILAKVVVDCSGDGDISHWAGEQYDEMKYHIGLVHRLGNIDRIDPGAAGYVERDIGGPTPIPSVNWVNMHGRDDQDGLDVLALSKLQQEYRMDIWDRVQQIRETPGYEDVFLLDTASQLGVRMSRIVDAEYKLTLEDTMTFKNFKDVIGVSGAWTSILYKGKRVAREDRPLWQIPFRSLVPKQTDNLLLAGRCFCFERGLVEDTRIIGTCLITGHGAGAAAGLAVKEGVRVRDLDIEKLKGVLTEQGAWLG